MATSSTEIANRALDLLGAEPILSLTDATARARTMNRAYLPVLRRELRKHPWSFAIKRVVLAPDSTAPVFGFDYAYTWPGDALRILPDVLDTDWTMEGRKILTDTGTSINCRYIRMVEDPNDFDAIFVEAFAAALAMDRNAKITQSKNYYDIAREAYLDAIREARKVNAFEQIPQEFPEDDWLVARY